MFSPLESPERLHMQRMGLLIRILFIPWLRVFSRTGNRPGSHGNVL